ncbi:MAG: cupredoxin domain-containing protein [Magnetospirillum sp. WYHS-4]
MRKALQASLAAIVALGLAACETNGTARGGLFGGCDTGTARGIEAEVWEKADVAAIRIRQGNFSPMVVHAAKGRPTILRIVNGDDEFHTFKAPEFFRNISIAKVTRGTDEDGPGCHSLLTIPAQRTVEIHFVPLNDGHYEFQDDLIPLVFSGGSVGIVNVR